MKLLFTKEEFKEAFGYDLTNSAIQGGFQNIESSCNAWMKESARAIDRLLSTCIDSATRELLYECDNDKIVKALKEAQMEQMRYIYESGNISQLNKVENEFLEVDRVAKSILEDAYLLTYY